MDLVNRICPVCHSNYYLEVFDQPTETIIGIGDIGYHHRIITDLRSLLSDQGLVYIEVPNLLKPNAKSYFSFEHVNFFTPTSLTNIMGVAGFLSDSLYTFDNGPEIFPSYPVIASTWKKSKHEPQGAPFPIRNNFEEALAVIEKFKKGSKKMVLKLQKKIKKILENTPKGRLAIWGDGMHTSQLFSETALGQAEIACIFDNDPKKHGSQSFGHRVEKFCGKPDEIKKTIDSILISSEASEDIIYKQISYLENHGINVYRLYRES